MRPGRGRGRGSGFSDDSRRVPKQPESRMQHGEGKHFGFQKDRRQEESFVAGGRGRGRHQYSLVERTAEVAVAGKHDRGPLFFRHLDSFCHSQTIHSHLLAMYVMHLYFMLC